MSTLTNNREISAEQFLAAQAAAPTAGRRPAQLGACERVTSATLKLLAPQGERADRIKLFAKIAATSGAVLAMLLAPSNSHALGAVSHSTFNAPVRVNSHPAAPVMVQHRPAQSPVGATAHLSRPVAAPRVNAHVAPRPQRPLDNSHTQLVARSSVPRSSRK